MFISPLADKTDDEIWNEFAPDVGFWALHNNNNATAKTILRKAMNEFIEMMMQLDKRKGYKPTDKQRMGEIIASEVNISSLVFYTRNGKNGNNSGIDISKLIFSKKQSLETSRRRNSAANIRTLWYSPAVPFPEELIKLMRRRHVLLCKKTSSSTKKTNTNQRQQANSDHNEFFSDIISSSYSKWILDLMGIVNVNHNDTHEIRRLPQIITSLVYPNLAAVHTGARDCYTSLIDVWNLAYSFQCEGFNPGTIKIIGVQNRTANFRIEGGVDLKELNKKFGDGIIKLKNLRFPASTIEISEDEDMIKEMIERCCFYGYMQRKVLEDPLDKTQDEIDSDNFIMDNLRSPLLKFAQHQYQKNFIYQQANLTKEQEEAVIETQNLFIKIKNDEQKVELKKMEIIERIAHENTDTINPTARSSETGCTVATGFSTQTAMKMMMWSLMNQYWNHNRDEEAKRSKISKRGRRELIQITNDNGSTSSSSSKQLLLGVSTDRKGGYVDQIISEEKVAKIARNNKKESKLPNAQMNRSLDTYNLNPNKSSSSSSSSSSSTSTALVVKSKHIKDDQEIVLLDDYLNQEFKDYH